MGRGRHWTRHLSTSSRGGGGKKTVRWHAFRRLGATQLKHMGARIQTIMLWGRSHVHRSPPPGGSSSSMDCVLALVGHPLVRLGLASDLQRHCPNNKQARATTSLSGKLLAASHNLMRLVPILLQRPSPPWTSTARWP